MASDEDVMLRVAARFLTVGEAAAARSALQAAGIEAYLADQNLVGINWAYAQAVGLIKLMVREEDVEVAREVLTASSQVLAEANPESRIPNPEICPECGSYEIARIPRLRIFLFVAALFLGIGWAVGQTALGLTAVAGLSLALLLMPSHRCRSCDHRWSAEIVDEERPGPPPDPADMAEVVCPRCGSIEVHEIDYRRLKAVPLLFSLAIVVIAPLWLALPKRLCDACGLRQ